jgi:hypothetical protein
MGLSSNGNCSDRCGAAAKVLSLIMISFPVLGYRRKLNSDFLDDKHSCSLLTTTAAQVAFSLML